MSTKNSPLLATTLAVCSQKSTINSTHKFEGKIDGALCWGFAMAMEEQIIGTLISQSGSDITPYEANNNMSTEAVAAAAALAAPVEEEPPKAEEEVQVPLPALQEDTTPYPDPVHNPNDPNSVGMGALANAATAKVEEVEVAAKRPRDPIEDGVLSVKKPKLPPAQVYTPAPPPPPTMTDPAVWENLMAQVRGQLRSMSSDECFSRALELQMLARSEVGNRSQHLSNAMDLMATDRAGIPVEPPKPMVKRHQPNLTLASGQMPGQRVTKAEREVSKQKPIKTNKAAPVPCMKMTPPLPPRCEHDNAPGVELPAFCQLVNFPTARYYGNCVMCDESEFAIPKQNKGVCNNCDVAIWVVNPSGMNIKWCKGCKNFRKWIDFGVKGYSSKCERCRHQQATRYANQKNKEAAPVSPHAAALHAPAPVVPPMPADPAVVAAASAAAAAAAAPTEHTI